jgi:hypothetical protein
MEGLNREAIKAPIYSASLTLALPPQTVRLPLKVPESLFAGATSTRAESSIGERQPSLRSSPRRILQSTRPTPGTLLRRASFSLRAGLFRWLHRGRDRCERVSSRTTLCGLRDTFAEGFGAIGVQAVFLGGPHVDELPPPEEDLLKFPRFSVGYDR